MSDASTSPAPIADGAVIALPKPEALTDSRIAHYMQWLRDERGIDVADYAELWQWSVDDIDTFWRTIWDYFDVQSATPVGATLGRREMPGAEWFPGTTLNFVTQFLQAAEERLDEVAIIGESQTRPTVTYTFAELIELAGSIRAGLLRRGVGVGDRVVGYLPNIPETVAAFLATASIGAVWATAAPEFGPQAVIDRFGQLEPTVFITCDGYHYGDKDVDLAAAVATIRAALPTVQHTIALPYNGRELPDTTSWSELISEPGPLEAVPLPFDHPVFVLFSSGTTGLPKAIVHGHGGITLESLKNHALSWDLGPGDRLMWYTTTAWMMWSALTATLLTGASIVCIDGNPAWPDMSFQWRLAERTKATMIGLSPAFVMGCIKTGLDPASEFDLTAIRTIGAAGSPLPAEGFVWLHEQMGEHAHFCIGSGGTDVCTGLLQGNPIVPVYAGEIPAKCLGVAAYAYDEEGNSIVGELGELVITEPMPSMPVRFWGDDDMVRYSATYYEMYPGVMRFGDWVSFTPHGSSVVTGRSDATLNRGGVRIGTAELYRVAEQLPEVADTLVVHLEDPDGGMGQLVMFVQPTDGLSGKPGDGALDDQLVATLRSSLRTALSPRHLPDRFIGVSGIPRNLTGKKLELPVKRIMQGHDPTTVVSKESMSNPHTLDEFVTTIAAAVASGAAGTNAGSGQ